MTICLPTYFVMADKLKKYIKNIKNKMMKISHHIYLRSRKLPSLLRNIIAILFVIVWTVFMTNPLLPWWFLILIGVWIFLPGLQYKYIWKYFKSDSIKKIENDIAMSIESTLQTNPGRYYKYQSKIKKIWKYFKRNNRN